MFGESYNTETRVDIPYFDLSVVRSCDDSLTLGRVGDCVHGIEVSLLFQHVRLGLPFPNKQLTQFGCTKGQPLACLVDSDIVDIVLRNAQALNLGEFWQLVNEKQSMREACDEQLGLGVEAGASDVSIVLHKEVSLGDAPLQIFVVLFIGIFRRIVPQHIFPHEESAIFADGVYRLLVLREPCAHNGLSVSTQSCLRMPLLLVHTPDARRQVLGSTEKESRIARPLYALHCVVVTSIYPVSHKGCEFEVTFRDVWC